MAIMQDNGSTSEATGSPLLVQAPESICILRLSALGDVTHVLPIIHTLQTHWPGTKITWVIGAFEHRLLQHLPGVEFIVFDKKAGWREYLRLRRTLSGRRFDVLLQMQVALRANIASLFIKAGRKIGYDAARAKDLHRLFINESIAARPQQHVVDGFFEFLAAAGLQEKNLSWQLPLPASAGEFSDQHVQGGKPLLVISPCSSHPQRNWHAEGYAKVADHAVNEYGCQVILSGGRSALELEMAERICSLANTGISNLVGKDTIPEFLCLLQRADAIITPDSGPAHLATCVDTPVIGLYAATNPLRSGPYKSVQWCVNKFAAACRSFLGKDEGEVAWGSKIEQPGVMDLIEVEDVIEKLDALMATKYNSSS